MKIYLITLLSTTALLLGVTWYLHYSFISPPFDDFLSTAYEWQNMSKGVVQTGKHANTREYKYYSLRRGLSEYEVVVLGSSRSYGLRSNHFQTPAFFNAAVPTNSFPCVLEEFNEFAPQMPNLKLMVVSVDLIAHLQSSAKCHKNYTDRVKAENLKITAETKVRKPSRKDLLMSVNWIRHALTNPERELTDLWTPKPYRCPNEDSLGIDYFRVHVGKCLGFRHDGSNTYAYLGNRKPAGLANLFPKHNNSYEFKTGWISSIIETVNTLKKRGVKTVFIIPPIFPTAVEQLISPPIRTNLDTARTNFSNAIRSRGLVIVDALDSSPYNCTFDDFVDAEHARSACFRKIIEAHPKEFLLPVRSEKAVGPTRNGHHSLTEFSTSAP